MSGRMIEVRGTGDGRGGESGEICVCNSLKNLKIELPAEGMSGIANDLRDKLSTPLSDIFVIWSIPAHIPEISRWNCWHFVL